MVIGANDVESCRSSKDVHLKVLQQEVLRWYHTGASVGITDIINSL